MTIGEMSNPAGTIDLSGIIDTACIVVYSLLIPAPRKKQPLNPIKKVGPALRKQI